MVCSVLEKLILVIFVCFELVRFDSAVYMKIVVIYNKM